MPSNAIISRITLTPDRFSFFINSWYNNTKFKELFIDLSASTWIVCSISLLNVLQKLDIFVHFHKKTARFDNLKFWIGSATLIRWIILDTSRELNTFLMISINILFLPYLANIDKFSAFFNNVTNQVIYIEFPKAYSVISRYGYALLLC